MEIRRKTRLENSTVRYRHSKPVDADLIETQKDHNAMHERVAPVTMAEFTDEGCKYIDRSIGSTASIRSFANLSLVAKCINHL